MTLETVKMLDIVDISLTCSCNVVLETIRLFSY